MSNDYPPRLSVNKISLSESKPDGEYDQEGIWYTYGVYSIKPDIQTTGDFDIPLDVKKIRFTVEVTYTN